ncbi:hypothetical protein ACHAXS_009653 [Conticribra weissflogii]
MSLSRRHPKRKLATSKAASLRSDTDTDTFLPNHHGEHQVDAITTRKVAKVSASKDHKTHTEVDESVDTNIGTRDMETEGPLDGKNGDTKETSTTIVTSTCSSSTTSASDLPSRQDSTAIPPAMYMIHQRVYAKDNSTGLLYPAVVRKAMWGPKPHQVKVTYLTIDSLLDETKRVDADTDQTNVNNFDGEETENDRYNLETNTHHYFVHYLGWNVKWDRWTEESCIYEDSPSSRELASKIMKEYNYAKPKKKNQKMTIESLNSWMKRRNEIEDDHFRVEKQKIGEVGSVEIINVKQNHPTKTAVDDEQISNGFKGKVNSSSKRHDLQSQSITSLSHSDNNNKSTSTALIVASVKKLNKETLERQAQLRQKGLQMKMKRSHSDRLHLPFTLKKVLVDEWEVITQCGMVHNLPAKVTARSALDKYLESKLEVLRKKEISVNCDAIANGKIEGDHESKDLKLLEREWVEMTDGIALVFDQALPIHLLFRQERGQYDKFQKLIRAQIKNSIVTDSGNENASSDKLEVFANSSESCKDVTTPFSSTTPAATNNFTTTIVLPQRMSEIYGCEHLLRLFIRLPSVIAATPNISEVDARRIFSKLGDFIRFLQRHQSVLFAGSYKKP